MSSRGRYVYPQDVVDLAQIERALRARGVEDVDEGVLWMVADLAHRACSPRRPASAPPVGSLAFLRR